MTDNIGKINGRTIKRTERQALLNIMDYSISLRISVLQQSNSNFDYSEKKKYNNIKNIKKNHDFMQNIRGNNHFSKF